MVFKRGATRDISCSKLNERNVCYLIWYGFGEQLTMKFLWLYEMKVWRWS